MKNELNKILCNVAEQIFESLAFLLLMPEEDEPISDDTPNVTASITFDGPFEGVLFLCVSEEMLPAIAVNMLGLMDDETSSVPQQRDAFKELLNVVCGNFLPQVVGTDVVFNVDAAEILPCEQIPPQHRQRPPEATATLNLEEGLARLALFVDQPITAELGSPD